MSDMIEGVKITPLKVFTDERGSVLHFMHRDRSPFDEFGEVYFSSCNPGVFKGWHLHKRMTLNYVCISGAVSVILVDGRVNSETYRETLTIDLLGMPFAESVPQLYRLVTIPPEVWNAYHVLGQPQEQGRASVIANFADIPHDPQEILRTHPDEFRIADVDTSNFEVAG